jgi:hypothetical protein
MTDDLFTGFDEPKENWCKLPFVIIENLSRFTSKAEICVVLYILRHTWGYKDYTNSKTITVDEFQYGRKRKDGTRIDSGTGLSEPSIRSGLKAAEANGFIEIATDDSDKGRVVKSYRLAMKIEGEESLPPANTESSQGVKSLPPDLKEFTPRGQTSLPRTEIDTLERYIEKDSAPADAGAAGDGEILNQPTSKNEEKSSHSDTTASGDTQEPPSSATPPKQKRQRKPNPLFDPIYNAIEHGFWEIEDSAGAFSPDDDKDNGGRISKVAWWHCGKSYKGVRTIGNPATLDTVQMHVEAIKKFATWVRAKGITIHDIAKYVEWYGKWVSEVKMQSQWRQSKAVHAPARPVLTDEQRAENLRKLQEARDAALNTDKEAV